FHLSLLRPWAVLLQRRVPRRSRPPTTSRSKSPPSAERRRPPRSLRPSARVPGAFRPAPRDGSTFPGRCPFGQHPDRRTSAGRRHHACHGRASTETPPSVLHHLRPGRQVHRPVRSVQEGLWL